MSGEPAGPRAADGPSGSSLRTVTSERAVRTVVCRIEGEADHETREAPEATPAACVAAEPALLVVDLAPLAFADSACLNALLRAHRDAEAAGVWFVVAGPGPQLQRLLEITGAAEVFTIRPSLHAVLGTFPG
ncbi:STAS domain-containing protein [Kitasatospora sp. NBC_01560]|uniref:STAS domain-containing protein n=1 Tax=Kitasatospora sp. NBC_01560 TaxID=2975965 RepID=UPI00386C9817